MAADESVIVLARFRSRPGRAAELKETLRAVQASSRTEPGCEVYDMFESADATNSYVLFERYHSRDALEAHRNSDHYRAYRARVPELLEEPVAVTVLRTVDGPS